MTTQTPPSVGNAPENGTRRNPAPGARRTSRHPQGRSGRNRSWLTIASLIGALLVASPPAAADCHLDDPVDNVVCMVSDAGSGAQNHWSEICMTTGGHPAWPDGTTGTPCKPGFMCAVLSLNVPGNVHCMVMQDQCWCIDVEPDDPGEPW